MSKKLLCKGGAYTGHCRRQNGNLKDCHLLTAMAIDGNESQHFWSKMAQIDGNSGQKRYKCEKKFQGFFFCIFIAQINYACGKSCCYPKIFKK